jgi:Cu/Ag efflux pump CusA
MFLMIVGEVIGYVVGMGLGLDVDTSATVGGAVVSVLAVVVLGGLITSTLLNIFVIPIVYERYSKRAHKQVDDTPTPAAS